MTLGLFPTALRGEPTVGFTVRGSQLLDARGEPFVMRGVNYPHAWFHDRATTALPQIAATGANAVRLVLSTGAQWRRTSAEELEALLAQCEALQLIAVVEVHDCTGYGDQPEAVPLTDAVAYWIEMKPVLRGREDRVILNLANEPFGNALPGEVWVEQSAAAIVALREAGFAHTLMVDAAHWGQDWQQVTLERAPEVAAADPDGNLVFSVHMYDVFDTEAKVRAYFDRFQQHQLALVVGEFAADHGPGKDVAEGAILRLAEERGIGYLGWSWSGNGGNLQSLDLVEAFDPTRLTPWGEILLDGPHGIRATARKASIFGD